MATAGPASCRAGRCDPGKAGGTDLTVVACRGASGLDGVENTVWQAGRLCKRLRAEALGQRPAVFWLTGYSGSGKSTIANHLEELLQASGRHSMLLDGDNIRHGLCRDLGFADADRVENVRRVAEVAKLMTEAGLIVIASLISPFRAERQLVRQLFDPGEFMEVFIDTPIEECIRRDPKGLYRRALRGEILNFTGIDSAYEPPEDPEIRLQTLTAPPLELAQRALAFLDNRGAAA